MVIMHEIEYKENETENESIFGELQEALQKVDKKFEKNITARNPLETEWLDVIEASIKGNQLNERVSTLVGVYTNLGDPTYSTLLRNQHSKAISWLDGDFFRLNADGTYITDLELMEANTELVRQKLKNPKSGFYNSIACFDLQLRLLNISALHYSFCVETKPQKKRSLDRYSGKFNYSEGENKLVYQGGKWSFVNMFNCYPDIFSPQYDNLNELDVFWKKGYPLSSVKKNPLFNPQAPYIHQDNVIYRNNEGLLGIEHSEYKRSDKEVQLYNMVTENNPADNIKGFIELRYGYLRDLKIDDQNHCNVCVIYAKVEGECIPLLVEYNHFDFDEKPIRFADQWKNPFALYGRSPHQLGYNASCWTSFLKAAKTYAIGKSLFPTRFIPIGLNKAVRSAGVSEKEFRQAIKGLGADIPYDESKYTAGANGIWTPEDIKSPKDIQLSEGEIASIARDKQDLATTVQTGNVGKSTATGVNYVASQEDAQQKYEMKVIFEHVVSPTIKMMLQDMSDLMIEEIVVSDVDTEFIEKFFGSTIENVLERARREGMIPANVNGMTDEQGMPIPLEMKINPITMKKIYALKNYNIVKANVEIQFEGTDYNKDQDAQKYTQLYSQVMQIIGQQNPTAGALIAQAAIKQLNILTDNPQAEEVNKIIEQAIQQMTAPKEPDPAEIAKTQAEVENKTADSNLKAAQAEEEQSRATRQNLENAQGLAVNQMLGV